jgi:hypothetical protein
MTLNIIPRKMKALCGETGEWHILSSCTDAMFWNWMNPQDNYSRDGWEECGYVDLGWYDSFEAVL